ncbi:MAG: hypothetical protein LBF51_07785 [Zoogloeaceae bacterium]|jgi:hypothetical protein|nr:hypothetical protein [Zoogloeaceae bacterium]
MKIDCAYVLNRVQSAHMVRSTHVMLKNIEAAIGNPTERQDEYFVIPCGNQQ